MGRPHFAQALVRHGYVSNNREAFERFYPRHTPEQQVLYLRTCIHNRLSKVRKWEILTIVSAEETEIS